MYVKKVARGIRRDFQEINQHITHIFDEVKEYNLATHQKDSNGEPVTSKSFAKAWKSWWIQNLE